MLICASIIAQAIGSQGNKKSFSRIMQANYAGFAAWFKRKLPIHRSHGLRRLPRPSEQQQKSAMRTGPRARLEADSSSCPHRFPGRVHPGGFKANPARQNIAWSSPPPGADGPAIQRRQRRQRRRISQPIAIKWFASTAQNATLRRGCAVLRRVCAANLFSTCRSCRFSGSIRWGDGAVLLLEVGSESLINDRAAVIGRGRI